jgi:holo-ACP synthase/triphosphoribosyl-dephospho-CoA synthase
MALKKLLAEKGLPCLSFNLNIPGFPKSNTTAKSFFRLCLTELKYHLKSHLIEIRVKETVEICDSAGDFFLAPFSEGRLSLPEIKQICEDFEENHLLGRFLDVDLNDNQGNIISSGKSKLCFFCKVQPAIECRRLNSHDQEEVRKYMFEQMAEYCRIRKESQFAKRLSSFAFRAILSEISLTPKPGLVDKFSHGSHTDMDFQTFINSSAAISGWFEELFNAGLDYTNDDLTKALPVIRNIGLQMESEMFRVTNQVNTQKGIIFLVGLSLFSCGKLYSEGARFETHLFRSMVKDICKDLVMKELMDTASSKNSHGEVVFQKYGFSGARGEAESGFETVFEMGLPQLAGMVHMNNHDLTNCFLSIASKNEDTNILYRCGPDVLKAFQKLCKNALDNFNDKNYAAIGEFCLQKGISPGGSADLLAVSIFLWLMINDTDSV